MYLKKLAKGSKVPVPGEAIISDDSAEHRQWIAAGYNVGFLPEMNGAVVVDVDGGKDRARELYRKWKPLLGPLIETARGIHAVFQGKTDTRKLIIGGETLGDIKGNGHTVFPPSVVKGWEYRFVPGHEWGRLPQFPTELFAAPVVPVTIHAANIRDAMKYIMSIFAVSGAGGHNSTFRAVCRLRDTGEFSEAEALAAMIEWNESNAEPKWTVKELLHKVRSAYSKTLKGG